MRLADPPSRSAWEVDGGPRAGLGVGPTTALLQRPLPWPQDREGPDPHHRVLVPEEWSPAGPFEPLPRCRFRHDSSRSCVRVWGRENVHGEILTEMMPAGARPSGTLQTFRADPSTRRHHSHFYCNVLLERALDSVGKRYRLFPRRYKVVHYGYSPWAEGDSALEEVVVLKLHGSIDWFDRRQYSALEKYRREDFGLEGTDHPVFKTSEPLRVVRLVDGPRF